MGVEEQIHEQALDRSPVVPDLVIARRRSVRSMLQSVQGRLTGERRAIRAFGFQLPGQRGQHRIVAQLIVIDEVFIAESDGEHPLADQRRQPVLDQVGAAIIAKTGSEPIDKPDRLVRGTQQQGAGVRRHPSGVERGDDPAPSAVPKSKLSGVHSVGIEATSRLGLAICGNRHFNHSDASMRTPPVRNPG